MELTQGMELAQVLKLSPGLLQSMEMLQMNTLELGAYLKELALENPVLEEAEPGQGQGQDTWEAFASQVPWLGDTPWTGQTAQEGDWGRGESPTESLAFLLEEQLARRGLSPELLAVCRYLAGLLDDDGRLDPEDLAGLRTAGVPAELLERGVEVLQSLEPAGVGARSLEECLLLQLRRLPGEHTVAQAICQGHLEELSKEHYGALARRLGVTQRQVEAAAREIRALSPSPVGEGVEPPAVPFIRPDVWVAEMDGELRVFVNQWDLPQYQVSQTYRQMLRGGVEAETADYLRQKLQQAQWVLTCVQRRRKTLEACVQALVQVVVTTFACVAFEYIYELVQAQAAYFRGCQAAPGPLLRREVAVQLGVHPSTVTRALRHKYLQCRQGLFPMEYFFARPMGAEGASPQRAKAALARMIQGEDPRRPLSDQALGERLQAAGMPLARRTVAKYRREMGLPPAYRRRR